MRRCFLYPAKSKEDGSHQPLFLLILFLVLSALLLSCSAPPRRCHGWISLSPSVTEILFAIGAGKEVDGVCSPADYPPAAGRLPRVASWQKVDVEAIVADSPKGCFTVDGMQAPRVLASLRRLGVPVHSYSIENVSALIDCILSIGRETGHENEAVKLATGFKKRVTAARKGLPATKARAMVVVGLHPLVAAGRESFLDDLLRLSGYKNVLPASGGAYPQLSMESVAALAPDVVIFPKGELPKEAVTSFVDKLNWLTGRRVSVVEVPADLLVRPGPRTAEAVELLAGARREEAER